MAHKFLRWSEYDVIVSKTTQALELQRFPPLTLFTLWFL